jgi:hypothetical protein
LGSVIPLWGNWASPFWGNWTKKTTTPALPYLFGKNCFNPQVNLCDLGKKNPAGISSRRVWLVTLLQRNQQS